MSRHRRRAVLAALVGGLSGLAGCGGQSGQRPRETFAVPSRTSGSDAPATTAGDGAETTVTRITDAPTQTARPVVVPESGPAGPATGCPDDAEQFDPPWVVVDEPMQGFFLYAETERLRPGETVTVRLRNFDNEPRPSGSRGRFDLQRRSPDGWHTVFGSGPDGIDPGSSLVTHSPGVAFTWAFPFTRDGVAELGAEAGYALCDPLEAGQYRFVYWGVAPDPDRPRAEAEEYAIDAPFTVAPTR